jgi:DNA-damage-inducible protein J
MTATATASLNTKLPLSEKTQFVETAESLGMSPSAAIRVFVRKFIECDGFPFAVRKGIPMSDAERAEIAALDAAVDNGTARTYASFADLLSEVDEELAAESPR